MRKSIIEAIERFAMARAAGGAGYSISVYQPAGEHAPGSLPIVFVTDADYFFGTAAELLALQSFSGVMAPAILVGIGYGAGIAEAGVLRWRDLTLPASDEALRETLLLAAAVGLERGGAAAFLSFLLDDLTSEIVQRYPAAAADHRILFGTSLGGLFATYALFTRPEAFRGIVVGSPALFWDRYAVLKLAPAFADKLRQLVETPRVFIGVGGTEEDLPEQVPAGSPFTLEQHREAMALLRTIGAARDLARDVRQMGLTDVEFMTFEGEGHQQVVPGLLNRGLRFVLRGK